MLILDILLIHVLDLYAHEYAHDKFTTSRAYKG